MTTCLNVRWVEKLDLTRDPQSNNNAAGRRSNDSLEQ